MQIVAEDLREQLPDNQIVFLEDCEGKDFKQKKEAEEIPDSAIFVLENLDFKPHGSELRGTREATRRA